MKQTAVEWLFNNLKSHFEHDGDLLECVQMSMQQAKEMEKEQMIKTFTESRVISVECAVWNCEGDRRKWESFEQYYSETFKANEK